MDIKHTLKHQFLLNSYRIRELLIFSLKVAYIAVVVKVIWHVLPL